MSSDFKVFKLRYSGKFEEIPQEELTNNLTLFNVLIFYIPDLKRMYAWMGKKAAQSLKKQIPQIRSAISKKYPELKILRNITIESGLEPPEFLSIIGIEEEILKSNIKKLEIRLLPVLSEINRMKDKSDKFFIANNYGEAIEIAQKIVNLAREIKDDSLEQDQINFINEAHIRARASEILNEIEQICKEKTKKFNQLVEAENYEEARIVVEEFKQKYADKYELSSIPLAQQLLLKEENMIYKLKIEQDKILKDIDKFSEKMAESRNIIFLTQTKQFLATIQKSSLKYFDARIRNKMDTLKSKYISVKNELYNHLRKLSESGLEYIKIGEFSSALRIFKEIIQNLELNNSQKAGE
ncbi:MAG: hypothetical protein ACTSP6_05885 [Promethearchaeota archaeon]